MDKEKLVFTPEEERLDSRADGVKKTVRRVYAGNWQYRFENTEFMQESFEKGQRESINGHMYASGLFWILIVQNFPNLAAAVNPERVLGKIMTHDLGEIPGGDISEAEQLRNGELKNKTQAEREDFLDIISSLPFDQRGQLIKDFDDFESQEIEKIEDIDVLMAKIIDLLEGNNFVLAYGNDLEKYSHSGSQILAKRMRPVPQAVKLFRQRGQDKAAEELLAIVRNHLNEEAKRGIVIDLDLSKL